MLYTLERLLEHIYIYIHVCAYKEPVLEQNSSSCFSVVCFHVCALSHQEFASCFCHYNSLELVNIVSVTSYFFLYSLVM